MKRTSLFLPLACTFVMSCLKLSAQDLMLNDSGNLPAQVLIGTGSGTMNISGNTVDLQGNPSTFGSYSDDMTTTAAVFDYHLPQPVPLPAGSDKMGLSYVLNSSEKNNSDFLVALRLIIQDARGGQWAIGTRFGGSGGDAIHALGHAMGKTDIESYVFTTNELGRLDAWVATSLDPSKYDDYDLPKPPYQLVGFRIIAQGKENETFSLKVSGLQALKSGDFPSPYWSMNAETTWAVRLNANTAPSSYGNFGWGPNHTKPNLKVSDLGLSPGDYVYSWELLDTPGFTVLAKKNGTVSPKDAASDFTTIPLMPPGTYHVHLSARNPGEATFHSFYLNYVVFRGEGSKTPISSPGNKSSLRVEGLSGTGFKAGHFPTITLQSQPLAGASQAQIAWSIEAGDKTVLGSGQGPAGKPLKLDLNTWARDQTTLWITAKVTMDGKDVDQAQRVVGLLSAASSTSSPLHDFTPKGIVGKFWRNKDDWSEGSEPIATDAARIQAEFGPWIKDAVDVGYNSVELPATWYELNPLPGVYQFQYLDKLVEVAKQNNLKVTLRLHNIENLTPLWLEREDQQSQEGLAHGLWGGGIQLAPTAASKSYNDALVRFCTALAAHYRNNPTVLGYTLAGMFFDHDWLDSSWNAQYVDYSPAMKKAVVKLAQHKYGSLASASKAYGKALSSWGEIELPVPTPVFDADGRLKPRTDALWKDYMACKIGVMTDSRLGAIRALRAGDPTCWAGVYATDSTPFYQKELNDLKAWMPCGSMESQFPISTLTVHGRFEPIGKIARTSELVDIGLTNILLQNPPGYNSFNNYWGFESTIAMIDAPAREAEERLKTWFSVIDELMGATWVQSDSGIVKNGAYLVSYETQLNILQHTFLGRFDDFLRPYTFRLGTDKVLADMVHIDPGYDCSLENRSYIYVPYCTMIMTKPMTKALVEWVNGGGRLILENTSGYWSENNDPNTLAGAFGLPEAVPQNNARQDAEPATWSNSSPFVGQLLSFRTREFLPPIEKQLTPWINNIPRAFLRPFRWKGSLPATADVMARYTDNEPAVLRLKVGKGEVLDFCGTIDWLGTPGLNAALDNWGRNQTSTAIVKSDPTLLTQEMKKGTTDFVIGRRFLNQREIGKLVEGKHETGGPASLSVAMSHVDLSVKSYHVHELLEATDLGSVSSDTLAHQGVSLSLTPGQAFILKAVPEDATTHSNN